MDQAGGHWSHLRFWRAPQPPTERGEWRQSPGIPVRSCKLRTSGADERGLSDCHETGQAGVFVEKITNDSCSVQIINMSKN